VVSSKAAGGEPSAARRLLVSGITAQLPGSPGRRERTASEISSLRRSRERLFFRLLTLPAVLIALFVAIIPLGMLVFRSFLDRTGAATFANYAQSFTNPLFMRTLVTTILMAVTVTVLSTALAYPVAYVMARHTRLRNVLMPAVTIPRMLPFVVIGYAVILLLAPFTGLLNKLFMAMGIIKEPLFILFDWPGLLIAFGYSGLVIATGMLTGVLMSVDPQLEEAAVGLGASRLVAFFKVTLPLTIPGVIASGGIVFTSVVTAYSIPVMLSGRVPFMIAPIIAVTLQSLGDFNLAFAQAVIVTILSLGGTLGAQFVLDRYGRT